MSSLICRYLSFTTMSPSLLFKLLIAKTTLSIIFKRLKKTQRRLWVKCSATLPIGTRIHDYHSISFLTSFDHTFPLSRLFYNKGILLLFTSVSGPYLRPSYCVLASHKSNPAARILLAKYSLCSLAPCPPLDFSLETQIL